MVTLRYIGCYYFNTKVHSIFLIPSKWFAYITNDAFSLIIINIQLSLPSIFYFPFSLLSRYLRIHTIKKNSKKYL